MYENAIELSQFLMIAPSSNGRTAHSDCVNRGSNPCGAAKHKKAPFNGCFFMLDVMALGFEPREKWFGYKRKAGISRPVREAYERSGMSLCMQRSKTIHVEQPICTGLRFLVASLCFFLCFTVRIDGFPGDFKFSVFRRNCCRITVRSWCR